MLTLEPIRLHWIKNDGNDDPSDLCAHSTVLFTVDDEVLVSADHGDFTVSAAAIYLLRTLEGDHTPAAPVGDHLFPCCGHGMFDSGTEDVEICGCPNGTDFAVTHDSGRVHIVGMNGQRCMVSESEWRSVIYQFVDQVAAFYISSQPKCPWDDCDRSGFNRMRLEWRRRRHEGGLVIPEAQAAT